MVSQLVFWWTGGNADPPLPKIILGAEDPAKFYTVVITVDPLPPTFWVQRNR